MNADSHALMFPYLFLTLLSGRSQTSVVGDPVILRDCKQHENLRNQPPCKGTVIRRVYIVSEMYSELKSREYYKPYIHNT